MNNPAKNRILIVDDNELIHDDFRKVLCPDRSQADAMLGMERLMFETDESAAPTFDYELDFATQGDEAAEKVRSGVESGRPFQLAFVDMRMPPGWDGLRTMIELKKIDPKLQLVVCSAFSDYDPQEIAARLGMPGGVLHLAKPFAADDIREITFILGTRDLARAT